MSDGNYGNRMASATATMGEGDDDVGGVLRDLRAVVHATLAQDIADEQAEQERERVRRLEEYDVRRLEEYDARRAARLEQMAAGDTDGFPPF